MSSRVQKQPDLEHPITIEPCADRIVAKVAGHMIADTYGALVLREASYPPVWYIPREDVDFSLLERSALSTYCPYKGDCSYYGIPAGGAKAKDAMELRSSVCRGRGDPRIPRVLSESRRIPRQSGVVAPAS